MAIRELLGNLATSSMALWRGTAIRSASHVPVKPLELYDMENCPYCRVVREALTELDLDFLVYPCPKGGKRFRDKVIALGGKAQFPYLVDPNTDIRLYESADIVQYLYEAYADQFPPARWRIKGLDTATAMAASATRATKGSRVRTAKAPKKPLILYSFESSPYARPVKELLCEMEIPYLLKPMGKAQWEDYLLPAMRNRFLPELEHKGRNRADLKARAGFVSIPYLIDPNTGTEMAESQDIIAYLKQTYGQ